MGPSISGGGHATPSLRLHNVIHTAASRAIGATGLSIRLRRSVAFAIALSSTASRAASALSFSETNAPPGAGERARAKPSSGGLERAVVVGGGIAGLASAAALQNIAGVPDVLILERSSPESFSRREGVGAGAQLGPNGLRALRAIGGEGLVRRVVDSGSILRGGAVVGLPGTDGPLLRPDTTAEDSGLPQVFVRWSALRGALRDVLDPDVVNVRCDAGSDLCGYEVATDGSLNLLSESGDVVASTPPDSAAKSLIVGADGAASRCRYWIQTGRPNIPADELDEVNTFDLIDTGRMNIKAVVPKSLGDAFEEGHTYSFFAPDGGVACFAGPAGEGHTYWAISVADEKDGETGEAMPGTLANIDDGSDMGEVKRALLAKLSGLGTDDAKFASDMIEATDPETMYARRSKEAQNIGPSLATPDGRVVLVGDAAHAMSGSYGQNPNLALEGAAELATCLRNDECIETALSEYSNLRVGRCVEMQRRSAERAAKAMRGEKDLEDVSKWIHSWDVQ